GAAVVTALGLALAQLARDYLVGTVSSRGRVLLSVAAVGVALAAGTAGTLRLVGRGPGLRWFAAGLVGGAAGVWLRWRPARARRSAAACSVWSRGRGRGAAS